MFKNLRIRKALATIDQDFYFKCFLSPEWSLMFDLNLHNDEIDKMQYIYQKINGNYPDLVRLMVYDTETNQRFVFGNILIEDYKTRRCSLVGGVDPDLLGKGYGSVGLYLFLNFIFSEMKMNKVTCQVYNFNSSSFKLLEKSGFILEGVLRQHAFNDQIQEFVDVKNYSLLASEFVNSRIYQLFMKRKLDEGSFICQEK